MTRPVALVGRPLDPKTKMGKSFELLREGFVVPCRECDRGMTLGKNQKKAEEELRERTSNIFYCCADCMEKFR